jgi:chaperonin GroEL (HSP60 family)
MERSVADVLGLIRHDLSQVTGGGAIEIELSNHLREFAKQVGGKTQLAIEKFADSLESIPLIIAENCGLDAIEILTTLKTLHQENKNLGVDMIEGISDAKLRGVVEPALMKVHAITSATEVANLILKLDNIIQGDLNGNGNKNPVNG